MSRLVISLGCLVLLATAPSAAAFPGVAVGAGFGDDGHCIELGAECEWDSGVLNSGDNDLRVAVTVAGQSSCVSSTHIVCSASELLKLEMQREQ